MRITILGHMGRDVAAADRLEGHELHVLGQWLNPGLVERAETSGGQFYPIDSITNVRLISDIVQGTRPDMFFTNFEDSIEAGVVDAVRRVSGPNLLIPCADREAAMVEWDKWELRNVINGIDPKYNPINRMVSTASEAREALAFFEKQGMEVALKPRHPTGGKGVKIMGPHLRGYSRVDSDDRQPSALEYALEVLADKKQEGLEIQQKFDKDICPEFTLQILTDGTVMIQPPATLDYPYREDGDTGPGTGGMGSFTMPGGERLPFLTPSDYDEAMGLMAKVLERLKERGVAYKGVLYPTFFKTPEEGLKIVEINARGGDPELINILDLMEDDTNYGEVLKLIALGELTPASVRYKNLASAMIYLVSPDYGYRQGIAYDFTVNPEVVKDSGCRLRFAAAEHIDGKQYRTVGSSRTVGLSAVAPTPWEARTKILDAIAVGFGHPLSLQYRKQIAQKAYIENLAV